MQVIQTQIQNYLNENQLTDQQLRNDHELNILMNDLHVEVNKQLQEQYDKEYNLITIETQKTFNIEEYLFLHDDILKYYTKKNVNQNISEWLKSQKDDGKLYNEIYDRVINKKLLKEKELMKHKLEHEIDTVIMSVLNNNNLKIYNDVLALVYEYNTFKYKTAMVKNKLKYIINIFSFLYNDTRLNIHDYISKKYNISIVINYSERDLSKSFKVNNIFNMYFEQYTQLIDSIQSENKYLKNTFKNISNHKIKFEQELFDQLSEQEGKYFLKWSELKDVEKLDRLESFSKFYINSKIKNKIQKTNNEYYTTDDQVTLFNLLKESLQSKLLTYHSIKWNVKKGIIDAIIFETTPHSENSNGCFKLKEKSIVKPHLSILSKKNEEVINKIFLSFLVKNKNQPDILDLKTKQSCFNLIKIEFDVKKIQKSDQVILVEKYENIYKIISEYKN